MNGEKIKDPTADRAVGSVAWEEKAYQKFGVRVGDTVTIRKLVDNGRQIRKDRARVVQFHPKLYWVRVEYLVSGQSECFNPMAFLHVARR